jgi:hypothetical protein
VQSCHLCYCCLHNCHVSIQSRTAVLTLFVWSDALNAVNPLRTSITQLKHEHTFVHSREIFSFSITWNAGSTASRLTSLNLFCFHRNLLEPGRLSQYSGQVRCWTATASRAGLGPTQPPIQRVPGTLSLGVKRADREADNSPPSSAEIKNMWSYTSIPPNIFMSWCLVKHMDIFSKGTFLL